MIRALRHSGFVVRDLDRSLRFYCDILGMKITARFTEAPGDYIDNLVGIKNVTVECAKLRFPGGGMLELLQYHSHPDEEVNRPPVNSISNRLGCSHAAFTVEDAWAVYERIKEAGLHCNSEPLRSPDGNVNVFYCHDPDGIILEVVEDLEK